MEKENMVNENMANDDMGNGNINNENKAGDKKKAAIKIIVPIIIVLIVAGIWFVRNSQKAPAEDQTDLLHEDVAFQAMEELDLDQLKSHGIPIMLDFGADDCPPCREMKPTIVKLHSDLQGKVIIKYMDVWENPELAMDYPVRVIPTQLFFDRDGNPYMPEDPDGSGLLIYTSRETDEHVFTAHEGKLTEAQLLEIFVEMGMEE